MKILKRKIFGKTISFIIERYGGSILGLISFILLIFFKPTFSNYIDLVKEFPTIGMCAFGFLLTFLGIILQGDSDTIKWFRSRENLYSGFIELNKKIVFSSLFLSLYSYTIGYIKFSVQNELIINHTQLIKSLLISIFISLSIKFICDFYMFLKIFYLLMKKD